MKNNAISEYIEYDSNSKLTNHLIKNSKHANNKSLYHLNKPSMRFGSTKVIRNRSKVLSIQNQSLNNTKIK
jgi:hypothetical protein